MFITAFLNNIAHRRM